MSSVHVKTHFKNSFEGILETQHGNFNIGADQDNLRPYDMLSGALASCLYATFLDIVSKKKLDFEKADIFIDGEKREEVPTWFSFVEVKAIIYLKEKGKEKAFEKSFELATKYCSIYQTLSKVSEMKYSIEFK
jgi:putative redox protein